MASPSDRLRDGFRALGIPVAPAWRGGDAAHEVEARFRVVARPFSQTLDGLTASNTFYEIECRAAHRLTARRVCDDLLASLGEHVSHVLSRRNWGNEGGGASHSMVIGVEA